MIQSMALPRYIPHYTVEDYQQWDGDWELWSGIAVAMSPSAKRLHQEICGELYLRFRKALSNSGCEDCTAIFELDWFVNTDTVLRPDLMILCHQKFTDYVEQTPNLVVEVLFESTRKRDLVYKREVYESLGVPFYLTVDSKDGAWRLLKNGESGFDASSDLTLRLTDDCEITLNFDNLMQR